MQKNLQTIDHTSNLLNLTWLKTSQDSADFPHSADSCQVLPGTLTVSPIFLFFVLFSINLQYMSHFFCHIF